MSDHASEALERQADDAIRRIVDDRIAHLLGTGGPGAKGALAVGIEAIVDERIDRALAPVLRRLAALETTAATVVRCRHCQAVLGVSTPGVFTSGGASFTKRAEVTCTRCGRPFVWHPSVS